MPEERQPQDGLGRLILRGMRERRYSYQKLASEIGASRTWVHRLVHGDAQGGVKLAHGKSQENRDRLARIVLALGLDPDEVDAAVADRHLVRRPAVDGSHTWVKTEDGAVEALVEAYNQMTPEQRAKTLRILLAEGSRAPRMPGRRARRRSSGR